MVSAPKNLVWTIEKFYMYLGNTFFGFLPWILNLCLKNKNKTRVIWCCEIVVILLRLKLIFKTFPKIFYVISELLGDLWRLFATYLYFCFFDTFILFLTCNLHFWEFWLKWLQNWCPPTILFIFSLLKK